MKILTRRLTALLGGLWLTLPVGLSAHGGHAGDHGWLEGAAQPLLSFDHLLAGLFVGGVVTLGVAMLARRARRLPRSS